MPLPLRRSLVAAALIAAVCLVALLTVLPRPQPPSEKATASTNGVAAQTGIQKKQPPASRPRCSHVEPRTAPLNGPGWTVHTDADLCVTIELPSGWTVSNDADGFALAEPTGHEGEYFETAYRGERTAVVSLRVEDADSWQAALLDPFPLRGAIRRLEGFDRIGPDLYARTYHLGNTIGTEYLYVHPDRVVVTIDAAAPARDDARQKTLRGIVRAITLQGVGVNGLRLSEFVD